jgi:hypothetical protein
LARIDGKLSCADTGFLTFSLRQLTPWGDPNLLQIAPFKISLAPKSTAMTLWNVTNNYTTLPLIQLTSGTVKQMNHCFLGWFVVLWLTCLVAHFFSDAGPWNDHLKGTASNIYNGFRKFVRQSKKKRKTNTK